MLAPGSDRGAIAVVAGTKDLPGVRVRAADQCGRPGESGAADYKDCIVARRRFSYVDHKTLEFTIVLESSCIDKPCASASETCSAGACVTAELSCQNETCAVPNEGQDAGIVIAPTPIDAGTPMDAEPLDATVDVATDVAPEPLTPCEPECPNADGGANKDSCAPGNECCVSGTSSRPVARCVPEGASCASTGSQRYARLCCTRPCGRGQRCVVIQAPTLNGGEALRTRCVRPDEPDPAFTTTVICASDGDCKTGLRCLPLPDERVAVTVCL